MIQILIVTHGPLAEALKISARDVLPPGGTDCGAEPESAG